VIEEMQDCGADELLQHILRELNVSLSSSNNPHMSQHKDHAHKKLRFCLQQQSTNLSVMMAVRLTIYRKQSPDYWVKIQDLARDDLTEGEVRIGLSELGARGLLT